MVEKKSELPQPSTVVQQINPNKNFRQEAIATHFYPFAFYILPNYNSLNIRTNPTQEDINS